MKTEDKFREFSIECLIGRLVDAKKHSFCNIYLLEYINWIVSELIQANKDVVKLIQSNDQEIFCLGVQMLFKDYLDQYNELCENPKWEQIIFNTIKKYKFYLNGN